MGFLSLIITLVGVVAVLSWWRNSSQPGASYRKYKLPIWLRTSLVVLGLAGLATISFTSLNYVDKALGIDEQPGKGHGVDEVKIPSASVMNFLGSGEQVDINSITAICTVYGYRNAADAEPDSVHQIILPASELVGRDSKEPLDLGRGVGAKFGLSIERIKAQVGNLQFSLKASLASGTGSSSRSGSFTIHELISAEALFARGFGNHWDGSDIGAIPVIAPKTSQLSCVAFAHKNDPLEVVSATESLKIYQDSAVYKEAWGEGTSPYTWSPRRSHRKEMPSGIGLANFVNPASASLLVLCCFLVSLALPVHRVLAFCGILVLGIFLVSWVDKAALNKAITVMEDTSLPVGQRELGAAQLKNTFFWKETAINELGAVMASTEFDESIVDAARNSSVALGRSQ